MNPGKQERETSQYSVSKAGAVLAALGILLVGKMVHICTFAVKGILRTALGKGEDLGVMIFILFGMSGFLYAILYLLSNTLSNLFGDSGNPALVTFAKSLLVLAAGYAVVLLILIGQQQHPPDYPVDWFLITFLLILAGFSPIYYDSSPEQRENEQPLEVDLDHVPLGDPVTLTTRPTEWEASIVADVLRSNGIPVLLEGTQTSMFKAEAPGVVHIVVSEDELEKAQDLLEELEEGNE